MTELQELCDQVAVCTDCILCKTRNHAVPGEGSETAEIMLVGEGPGFHEDQQGRPFVGASGRFLEQLLASIGLTREQVYIANVVKCRPPNNRDPLPEEVNACRKYLDRQIKIIKPKLIATLGRHAMASFFPNEKIGKVHGQLMTKDGLHLLPLYHPAAALHAGSMRRVIEEDFQKMLGVLEQVRKATISPPITNPQTKQMKLF